MGLLGNGSGCVWRDNSTLTVYLGYGSTVAAGVALQLREYTIMRGKVIILVCVCVCVCMYVFGVWFDCCGGCCVAVA